LDEPRLGGNGARMRLIGLSENIVAHEKQ
jgi:hypothetical protein